MSYLEVRRLIDEGNLEEAIDVARKDIECVKNESTCQGLFDVMKEYCIKDIKAGNDDRAMKCLKQMEVVSQGVSDPALAKRIIDNLELSMIPHYSDLKEALRMGRMGQSIDEFLYVSSTYKPEDLDDRLHESYGQLIYYYLRDGLKTIGPDAARDALRLYLSLNNPRPSSIHSSIVNQASHICAEYPEINLLEFIKQWGVENLTEEDMKQVELSDRVISPLYMRLIDRCFALGFHIDDIVEVFTMNKNITVDDVIDRICRKTYSTMYDMAKRNPRGVLEIAQKYVDEIKGRSLKNQYHSKALGTLLNSITDDQMVIFANVMEKWGIGNFMEEDWKSQKKGPKEYPSLAQRSLQAYIDCIKLTRGKPADEFEGWLKEAVARDPRNDQNQRQLARLLMAKGEREEAEKIYKRLLVNLNKYYVWYELSLVTSDRDLRKSALCKALLLEENDEKTGDIRLELASIMIEDGQQEEAARELLTYYNVYTQKQWRLKQKYDNLQKQIVAGTQPSKNNKEYYIQNVTKADEYILGDAETYTMKAVELVRRKSKYGHDYTTVTLLSADGLKAVHAVERMPVPESEIVGKSYIVKCAQNETSLKVLEVSVSNEDVDLAPLKKVGYIDGLDKARGWFHVYSSDSSHFVADNPSVEVYVGDFVEFYTIIPKDNQFKTAAIVRRMEYREGVDGFGTCKAVVARVDYNKHLFNCVSEDGQVGMVGYESGSIPQAGEMLRVAYIRKRERNSDNRYTKYISIEPSDEECGELRKVVVGPIHLLKNEKGFEYGFINYEDQGYYVSGYFMKNKGIGEGDMVEARVVNNGSNWFAFEVTKK